MKHWFSFFPLGAVLACGLPLSGQMLVVDRGIQAANKRLGKRGAPGFVGDHFQIGSRGEIWIIDALRTWAATGGNGRTALKLSDIFERISLFGGIEATPPEPDQPPQPECDCHNLIPVKSGSLPSLNSTPNASDVRVTAAPGGGWQVDFPGLRWFVPGGVAVQFGVMGVARVDGPTWLICAGEVGGAHELRAFDGKGKLEAPYTLDGAPLDARIGLNVQVWAHKMAPVTARKSGTTIDVVLRGDTSFDAAKIDSTTLRFGPKKALPISSHLEMSEGHTTLFASFRFSDTGLLNAVESACLTGLQQDKIPFEGCDLVAKE